jgi:hypothetical protein
MRSMVEGAIPRAALAGACHRAGRRPDPLGGLPPPLRGISAPPPPPAAVPLPRSAEEDQNGVRSFL